MAADSRDYLLYDSHFGIFSLPVSLPLPHSIPHWISYFLCVFFYLHTTLHFEGESHKY